MAKTYKNKTKMPDIVKNYILDLFKQNKVDSVEIRFSGSGDDGHVDDVEFYPDSISSIKDDMIMIPKEVWDSLKEVGIDLANHLWCPSIPGGFDSSQFTSNTVTSGMRSVQQNKSYRFESVIQGIMDYWICNENPVDWVNNEGGQGSCVLSVNKNKLVIELSTFEWVMEEGPTWSSKL